MHTNQELACLLMEDGEPNQLKGSWSSDLKASPTGSALAQQSWEEHLGASSIIDPGQKNYPTLMTHKYRGSIIVHSISKSVRPNEEQKEMTSGFQQGILSKH